MGNTRRARRVVASTMLGYMIGTFPTADLVSRRAASGPIDLRRHGTGNPGAANAIKVLGKRAGYTVMAVDIAKGAVASAAGAVVGGPLGAHAAGSASVVGHCLPVWNGFRGGKGVAASVGQCLATFPAYFPIDLAVAAATAANPKLKQRAFTATVVSSAAWVVGGLVWWRRRLPNLWGPTPTAALPLAAAASSAVIVTRFLAARPVSGDVTSIHAAAPPIEVAA